MNKYPLMIRFNLHDVPYENVCNYCGKAREKAFNKGEKGVKLFLKPQFFLIKQEIQNICIHLNIFLIPISIIIIFLNIR